MAKKAALAGKSRSRSKKARAIDPITLQILGTKVSAAAEEMSTTLQRSSRSMYVKEAADFSTGIADLHGKMFAYPPNASIPFFVDADCSKTIGDFSNDLDPGDVIVTNDPYLSGGLATHLPDIHMVRPYFHKGEIVAYGWCFIHSTDIGGVVPSSISPSNNSIFQEGLRIPPTKIVAKGRFNKDFVDIYTANCRTPDANMGDMRAMLASLHVGQQRVSEMIARHGVANFLLCQAELQNYSESKARAVLRRVPNGVYEFWDYMDDDMVTRIPLRVRVRMTIHDGNVELDFSGTDPQVQAAYNIATLGRRHEWLTMRLTTFILTHDRSIHLNAGIYRPISVKNPAGTVLNAEFPDAVGIRHAPARRLNDAMTGALLKAAPEMMTAPTCGAAAPLTLAENDPVTGKRSIAVLQPMRGGMGARKGSDGVDARDVTLSNMNNHPIETVEAETGVIIREYDILPDSGGAGQWRGGVGQLLTIEVLRDGGVILARGMERMRFPAWGVGGGKPGAVCRAILNLGKPNEKVLGKIDRLNVNAGDTITIFNPGASGYGDPFLRDPERVLRDVENGFVTPGAAASEYGVALNGRGVDSKKTSQLRQNRVRSNADRRFDFGPARVAWEQVFDDESMCALNRLLHAFPKSVRQQKRRALFESVVPELKSAGFKAFDELFADLGPRRTRLEKAMQDLARQAMSLGTK